MVTILTMLPTPLISHGCVRVEMGANIVMIVLIVLIVRVELRPRRSARHEGFD